MLKCLQSTNIMKKLKYRRNTLIILMPHGNVRTQLDSKTYQPTQNKAKEKNNVFLLLNTKRKNSRYIVFQRHYTNQTLKIICLSQRQYYSLKEKATQILHSDILRCLCYAVCVQDHPPSRSQQVMTLAYSCDFLLIIVALSKINNTIQQDFN